MASNERVHPDCVNASNPYHECGVACLEKITQGHVRKDKKKSDYGNGIKGEIGKKINRDRRANPSCPKASNPYHECNEYCPNTIVKASPRGNEKKSGPILGGPLSFRKKKSGSDSLPRSPGVVNNASPVKAVYPADNPSPRPPFSAKKRPEADNGRSSSSSHLQSDESYSQDHSFNRRHKQFSEIVPVSEIDVPDGLKSPRNGSITNFAFGALAKQEQNRKIPPSPKAVTSPVSDIVEEVTTAPNVKSMKFNFSGISHATEESDLEDSLSVVSDSYVAVGKYHVRPNLASTLHSIMEKYGDIAANCHLESASLRAYHLECLCSVVLELHSTPLEQLTKAKVKEMLAVLKDVESAEIDVSWLRIILNERSEIIDLNNRYQATDAEKAECDREMESSKKQIELLMEDLTRKEKEVAETKTQIEETRAHLEELELESSQLTVAVSSAKSKIEKFHGKPLAEEIL